MNQEKIGYFITNNRKKLSLTQEMLAEKLNVSKNAVSKWERGLNMPDVAIMEQLCKILNISLNELFAGEYQNLEIKNLYKVYETKMEKVVAIDNASFKFTSGKFYAIMGHSGSGKSTLLNILGTLEEKTAGEYFINNENTTELKETELDNLRKKNIGFIFQNYLLDPNLNALENVMLPMYINENIKKENRKKKALELLSYVNLSDRTNHFPHELSGGEKQRVAIARALANDANIIIADEPTGNLDEENEKIIFTIFRGLASNGKCVIVVSHNDNILKYADVVLYMQRGKLGVYHEGK